MQSSHTPSTVIVFGLPFNAMSEQARLDVISHLSGSRCGSGGGHVSAAGSLLSYRGSCPTVGLHLTDRGVREPWAPCRRSNFRHIFADTGRAAGLIRDRQFRDPRRMMATALSPPVYPNDRIRAITGHEPEPSLPFTCDSMISLQRARWIGYRGQAAHRLNIFPKRSIFSFTLGHEMNEK